MKKVIAIVLMGATASACAGVGPTLLSPPKVIVPESLTRCRDLPAIPEGNYTDVDLAVFIAELEFTAEDCRDTLDELVELIKAQQEE